MVAINFEISLDETTATSATISTSQEMMQSNSTVLRESNEKMQSNTPAMKKSNEIVQSNSTVESMSVSRESDGNIHGNSTTPCISDETMLSVSTSVTHVNPAFIVLKEHTPMLLGLLSDPDKLSDELWAKDLLSSAVRDRIKTTLGFSRYNKASMILTEVSRYIELPDSKDVFTQFCDLLVNHGQPGLKEIAEKMISLVKCSNSDIEIDASVTTHEVMEGTSRVSRESDEMMQGNSTVSRELHEMMKGNSTVPKESNIMMQVNSTKSKESNEMMQGNSTVPKESNEMMQDNSAVSIESDEFMQGDSTVLRELHEMMQGNSTVPRESDEMMQGNSIMPTESNEMMQDNSTMSKEMMQDNSAVSIESDEFM